MSRLSHLAAAAAGAAHESRLAPSAAAIGGRPNSHPGETFSASFAGGPESNNTPLATQVQWRLVTGGGSATLHSGSVVVLPGDSHCG